MEPWRARRSPAIVQVWYAGHGGRPRPRRRAARPRRRQRPAAVLGPHRRGPPPAVRSATPTPVTYDALARLLAPRPRPARAGATRSASGSPTRPGRSAPPTVDDDGDDARGDAPRSATPATAPAPTWCRCTPGVRPTPPGRPAASWRFARVERRRPGERADVDLARPLGTASRVRDGTRLVGRCPRHLRARASAATAPTSVAVDLVIDRRLGALGRERDRRVDPAGAHPPQPLRWPTGPCRRRGPRRRPRATPARPPPASRSRPRRSTRRRAASPLAIAMRSRTARTDMARSSRA